MRERGGSKSINEARCVLTRRIRFSHRFFFFFPSHHIFFVCTIRKTQELLCFNQRVGLLSIGALVIHSLEKGE